MRQLKKLERQNNTLIDRTVRELAVAYQKYQGSVQKFLLSALFAEGILQPQYSQTYINSVLAEYTSALQKETERIAEEKTEEAFVIGVMLFYEQIGSPISKKEAKKTTAESGIAYRYKAEIKRLLTLTVTNTDSRIQAIVRKAFADSLVYQQAQKSQQARLIKMFEQTNSASQFEKLLRKEGFVGIVDSRGHIWKPDVYAKMVMRTKLMDSNALSQIEYGAKEGISYAYISNHHVNNPCNLWEHTVICLDGSDPRLPTYADAKATGEVFHPNCQHRLIPFRFFADIPATVIARTQSKYGYSLSQME